MNACFVGACSRVSEQEKLTIVLFEKGDCAVVDGRQAKQFDAMPATLYWVALSRREQQNIEVDCATIVCRLPV